MPWSFLLQPSLWLTDFPYIYFFLDLFFELTIIYDPRYAWARYFTHSSVAIWANMLLAF